MPFSEELCYFYISNGEGNFCPQCADDVVAPVGEKSVILKREGEQMFRRNLIALSILLGLAACGGEQPVEKAKPGEMRVMSVSVGVADSVPVKAAAWRMGRPTMVSEFARQVMVV